MAYIAEQVEVDDSHNEVYVIGNKCFTLISQELNGTVVGYRLLSWNPWQEVLLRGIEALRRRQFRPMRC